MQCGTVPLVPYGAWYCTLVLYAAAARRWRQCGARRGAPCFLPVTRASAQAARAVPTALHCAATHYITTATAGVGAAPREWRGAACRVASRRRPTTVRQPVHSNIMQTLASWAGRAAFIQRARVTVPLRRVAREGRPCAHATTVWHALHACVVRPGPPPPANAAFHFAEASLTLTCAIHSSLVLLSRPSLRARGVDDEREAKSIRSGQYKRTNKKKEKKAEYATVFAPHRTARGVGCQTGLRDSYLRCAFAPLAVAPPVATAPRLGTVLLHRLLHRLQRKRSAPARVPALARPARRAPAVGPLVAIECHCVRHGGSRCVCVCV